MQFFSFLVVTWEWRLFWGFWGTINPIRIAMTPIISSTQLQTTPQLQRSDECARFERSGAQSQHGPCCGIGSCIWRWHPCVRTNRGPVTTVRLVMMWCQRTIIFAPGKPHEPDKQSHWLHCLSKLQGACRYNVMQTAVSQHWRLSWWQCSGTL